MDYQVKTVAGISSNMGKVRSNNEDNFYVNSLYMKEDEREQPYVKSIEFDEKSHLYVICDGMGGESLGELASFIVVNALEGLEAALKNTPMDLEEKKYVINKFIQTANDKLCSIMKTDTKTRMGTTLAALYIESNKAMTFNLGDSRVYLYRNGKLSQLTDDHTEAQRMVRLGVIDSEEAKRHRSKNQLTRHLGILPEEGILDADFQDEIEVHKDDVFILCSDGLTDMVSNERIHQIIQRHHEDDDIHEALTNEALANGGHDNVTVLAIRVESISSEKSVLPARKSKKKIDFYTFVIPILIILSLSAVIAMWRVINNSFDTNSKKSNTTKNQTNNNTQTPTVTIVQDNTSQEDNNANTEESVQQEPAANTNPDVNTPPQEIPDKYTIKAGDSLINISERYYGNIKAVPLIMDINDISNADKIKVGEVIKLPSIDEVTAYKPPAKDNITAGNDSQPTAIPLEYTIQTGDNLFRISEKFYGNANMVDEIMALNGLADSNKIEIGQVIKLPKAGSSNSEAVSSDTNTTKQIPETYTVQQGETIYSISRKFYGTDSEAKDIMELNDIGDNDKVYVGQVIKLPRP